MVKSVPSYEKLFLILNRRIGVAVENGDTDLARKEIDILERLVKIKKIFMDFAERAKSCSKSAIVIDTKIEKEKLLNEIETRLERIRIAKQ